MAVVGKLMRLIQRPDSYLAPEGNAWGTQKIIEWARWSVDGLMKFENSDVSRAVSVGVLGAPDGQNNVNTQFVLWPKNRSGKLEHFHNFINRIIVFMIIE